jgi:hypothetical protein
MSSFLLMSSMLLLTLLSSFAQASMNVTIHSNLTGIAAVTAVESLLANRTLLTFVGFTIDAPYANTTHFRDVVLSVLAKTHPSRTVVNAGGVAGGVGDVYAIAREFNFSTIGIVSSALLNATAKPDWACDEIFVVTDASLGGFESSPDQMHVDISYNLSPKSEVVVSVSSQIVGLGGGRVALQELAGAVQWSTPASLFHLKSSKPPMHDAWSFFKSRGYVCDDVNGDLRDRCFVCDGDASLCSGEFDRSNSYVAMRNIDWWSPKSPENITSIKIAVLALENTLIISDPHTPLGYTWLPGVVESLRTLAADHVLLIVDNLFEASCQQYTTVASSTTVAPPSSTTTTPATTTAANTTSTLSTTTPATTSANTTTTATSANTTLTTSTTKTTTTTTTTTSTTASMTTPSPTSSRKRFRVGGESSCTPYANRFDFNETLVSMLEFKIDDMADTLSEFDVPLLAAVWLSSDATVEQPAKPSASAFLSAINSLVLFRNLNVSAIESVLVIGSDAGRVGDNSCVDRQFADSIAAATKGAKVTFQTPQQWLLNTPEEKYDCTTAPTTMATDSTSGDAISHTAGSAGSHGSSNLVDTSSGDDDDVTNKILFFFIGFGGGAVLIGLICWLVARRQKRTSGYERLLSAE